MAVRKKKLADFVLDSSVTLAWFLADEADAYADAVGDRMPSATAIVPAVWHLEVTNVLVVAERRKRTTAARSAEFLTILAAFSIWVDEQTAARAWGETLNL